MEKTVIASDIVEMKNIIKNGYDGFIEPIEKMSQLIVSLMEDADKLNEIGINARKTAAARYDWKIIVDNLVSYWSNN